MIHLPSGQDDFQQIITNKSLLYVDKTYFIKEWWESSYDQITLITRPQRFGKTLNMSMIEYFFSIQHKDSMNLFEGLFISSETQIMLHQGQYPVIYLTFGDIKTGYSESIKNQIKMKIWQIYLSYKKEMLNSEELDVTEKEFITSITHQMDDDVAMHSIQLLCCFLNKIYGEKSTIVILDEYDSLLTKNWNLYGNEDEWDGVKDFVLNFICSTFKENKFLMRGLITGVTNVPLSFDLSGANNINVYTINSSKYSNCFGFTSDEIEYLIDAFNFDVSKDDIENWYGGYKIGYDDVYVLNPWSVCHFFNESGKFSNYLVMNLRNDFVKEILKDGPLEIKDYMVRLIQGKSVKKELNNKFVYRNYFVRSEDSILVLLLSSGFLTVKKEENSRFKLNSIFSLKIPNIEVIESFAELINEWFEGRNFFLENFFNSLFEEDVAQMELFVNNFISQSSLFFNQSQNHPESVIHAFILGLVSFIRFSYSVTLLNENENESFFVMLKPIDRSEYKNSFIFGFEKHNLEFQEEILSLNDSIFEAEIQLKFVEDLKNEGFEQNEIKQFSFAFSSSECSIKFKETDFAEAEAEAEVEAEAEIEAVVDTAASVVVNDADAAHGEGEVEREVNVPAVPLFKEDGTPNFEKVKSPGFKKNDRVYVIDPNKFDIWEAVLVNLARNHYEIHYPEFPQDDEVLKSTDRMLVMTERNKQIYKAQEQTRINIEAKQSSKKKVKKHVKKRTKKIRFT